MTEHYETGNYATIRDREIIQIRALNDISQNSIVMSEKGIIAECPYHALKPLPISDDILQKAGMVLRNTNNYPLHTKVIYSLSPTSQFFLQGHLYEDKGIWTFKDITLYNFHQLQNLLRICATGVELVLF